MRAKDIKVICIAALVPLLFIAVPGLMDGFKAATAKFPYIMSFIKFAVLSTFGECIGLRLLTGDYNRPGFGIVPKALVWGVLGIGIKAAFTIFGAGAPTMLAEIGLPVSASTLANGSFGLRLLTAFTISASLNCIFAPVFMTLHKATDMHIAATGGSLGAFFSKPAMGDLLQNIDWRRMWGFVFRLTIPLFWIPMHTVTFLLPSQFQVLFAALLGVALGVILALASVKKTPAA
ncbi:hypothetical protein LJC23_06440 [Desulfovibrio sp. OttesenSCG-928-I05]|nr:hypothetical protein [Desulfovibrio sp. OttesenSCG-928-I05]